MSTQRNEDDRFATAATRALAALATSDADRHASASVAAALMDAFSHQQRPAAGTSWRRWLPVAAMLVLSIGGMLGWLGVERGAPGGARVPNPASRQAESAFVPWPGAQTLPAFESGELVRTRLPARVLPLLGIPLADAPADGHVIADVLYGQDGQPRAVRVISGLRP